MSNVPNTLRDALQALYEMTSRYAISDTDYGIVCNAAVALATTAAPSGPAQEQTAGGDPLVTLVLGGIDGDEYDSWDLEVISGKAIDALQSELVRTSEPVMVHLYRAAPTPSPAVRTLTDAWISVKDALPEVKHECTSLEMDISDTFFVRGVAVDGGDGIGLGHYAEDGKWHCYGGDYDFMHITEVTHYMPVKRHITAPNSAGDTAEEEQVDQYGNPLDGSEMVNCCFPDCGCDGARLCMAKNGASNSACSMNIERGSQNSFGKEKS